MRRRDFITIIGGAAAWPIAARAQQLTRMRRVGVLMNGAANQPVPQARVFALQQALQQLGWNEGGNLHVSMSMFAGTAAMRGWRAPTRRS
jgi:putative ABC transport system substrate-binding protein